MIELIPAIDIIDGKCVPLSQGDYNSQKIYNENPLEVAKEFEDYGIRRLHVVDLDGAASSHIVNYKVLDRIASHTSLVIDFGGGIKGDDGLRMAFDYGTSMMTLGSVAVKNPSLFSKWLEQYGSDSIILGADVRNDKIAVSGWLEESVQSLMDFLDDNVAQGVTKVLCTDISKYGMLQGTSVGLYKDILSAHPDLYLIASGGVSSVDDIYELNEVGVPAVVFGKALYEGRICLRDLKEFVL